MRVCADSWQSPLRLWNTFSISIRIQECHRMAPRPILLDATPQVNIHACLDKEIGGSGSEATRLLSMMNPGQRLRSRDATPPKRSWCSNPTCATRADDLELQSEYWMAKWNERSCKERPGGDASSRLAAIRARILSRSSTAQDEVVH